MSGNPPNIYIFSVYANPVNLIKKTGPISEIYEISFDKSGILITLSETNSRTEDRYSMNIHSAKYIVVEGTTESKEAMIHHHPQGHTDKHLQFILSSGSKKRRLILEFLDREDYIRCIKGFIYTTKHIIDFKKRENNVEDNLNEYFFNDKIEEIAGERQFLLKKIREAYNAGKFFNDNNKPINPKELEELKKESHLLPFLEWEEE